MSTPAMPPHTPECPPRNHHIEEPGSPSTEEEPREVTRLLSNRARGPVWLGLPPEPVLSLAPMASPRTSPLAGVCPCD